MKKLEERTDPLTGEKFLPKKALQRFASPENRIKYNNQRAKELRDKMAYITKPQIANLKILEELLKDKKEAEFHVQYLLGKGLNMATITHHDTYEGVSRHCMYNYILIRINDNTIKIIKL